MKKRFVKIAAAALALLLTFGAFASCAPANKSVLKLGKNSISVGMLSLMTSLVKSGDEGAFANYLVSSYGSYNSTEFWGTVVDTNGTTNAEAYTKMIIEKAKMMLYALELFDKEKLELPQSTVDKINEEIQFFIDYDGNGSKNNLNNTLSAYGANIDTLRDYKIMNAKIAYLEEYLYGADGSKIGDNIKQDYLEKNYVCFKQILFPVYKYIFETDKNGDDIYYHLDSETNKLDYILYDTVNGSPVDGDGDNKFDTDDYDKVIYYSDDGKIAYDKDNGKRSVKRDADGNEITTEYSSAEKSAVWQKAQAVLKSVEEGNYAGFEALIALYDDNYGMESEEDRTAAMYLGTNVDYSTVYTNSLLADYVKQVSELKPGQATFFTSSAGYHIMMRYEVEKGAYGDKQYTSWFTDETYGVFDFNDNLINELFVKKLENSAKDLKINEALASEIIIDKIEPNYSFK